MRKIIKNIEELKLLFHKIKNFKEPIVIEVEKFYKNNTNQQLRSFWRLIKVCRNFMNLKGNSFSKEQVASYFKIQAGHYDLIGNEKIPKSIDFNSGTTTEDMKDILKCILDFGKDNHIEDCDITSYETQEILNNYK